MSRNSNFLEPSGLRVTVDKVEYVPHAETPADRPHCFAYFISIHNGTDQPVTIKGRKWVVTNKRGEITALEGEGVVGETPTIEPGEAFSYNSFHLLDTPTAVAEGSYLGLDAMGRRVLTRIPKFEMVVPQRGIWRNPAD
ncbi:MAG: ApaG domain protein [Pedosphaera sp.]|nr:ApaG domain protein [Pedosphaera sp.]